MAKTSSAKMDSDSRPDLKRDRWWWIPPPLIGLALSAMTVWSWRKWPDPLIDFGHELYVPWRIADGDILYRDIATPYGPLSSCLNALFFKLFGVSLTTLIVCNLLILLIFTMVLYRLFSRLCDRVAATAACMVLIFLFSFSQYVGIGNYNFITPYSHESTHGIVLAGIMIYLMHRFGVTGNTWHAGFSGFCLGLILLTKPEVALATIFAVLLWLGLWYWHPAARDTGKTSASYVFGLGVLTPQVFFWLYFRWHLPAGDAWRALLGCWIPLVREGLKSNVFYAIGAGLDEPGVNALRLLSSFLKMGVFFTFLVVLDFIFARFKKVNLGWRFLSSAALFIFLLLNSEKLGWQEIGQALPLVVVGILIATLCLFFMRADNWQAAIPFATLSAWAIFSLALLAKMILNARLYHYGFYLALPATVVLTCTLLWLIPEKIVVRPRAGILFRWLAASAIAAGVAYHFQWSNEFYQAKTYVLARGNDAIVTYREDLTPLGPALNETLDWLEKAAGPDDSLVVLPEGAMVNYLSRRRNPTRYLNFLPPELLFYGEQNILASMKAHKPEWIILIHRDTTEFGFGYFGSDPRYGKQIMDWIKSEYAPTKLIGAEPLQDDRFGIKILRRRL